MRTQLSFVKWEIPIGGPFPRQQYEEAITAIEALKKNMQLVLLASAVFVDFISTIENAASLPWLHRLQMLLKKTEGTRDSITMLLTLLSNSITTATPLPPRVHVPEMDLVSHLLGEQDDELLSAANIAEPGRPTFAVIQIGRDLMREDLGRLLDSIKELFGEMEVSDSNFGFEMAPLLEN